MLLFLAGRGVAAQGAPRESAVPAVGRWAGPSACVDAIPASTFAPLPITLRFEAATPVPPLVAVPLAAAAQELTARARTAIAGASGETVPSLDTLADWRAIAFGMPARLHLDATGLRWIDAGGTPPALARLLERTLRDVTAEGGATVPWPATLDAAGVDVAIALVPDSAGGAATVLGTTRAPRVTPAVALPDALPMRNRAWMHELDAPLRVTMEFVLDAEGRVVPESVRDVGPWHDARDARRSRHRADAVRDLQRVLPAGRFTALRLGDCPVPHRARQIFEFER